MAPQVLGEEVGSFCWIPRACDLVCQVLMLVGHSNCHCTPHLDFLIVLYLERLSKRGKG